MISMTGYGKFIAESNEFSVKIELKSVNNRFLDVNIKSPKIFFMYEDMLRKIVSSKLSRGRVDVFVSYEDKREKQGLCGVDLNAAKGYIDAAALLCEKFNVESDLTASVLLRMSDVIKLSSEDAGEELIALFKAAAEGACDSLNAMRRDEGGKLLADILQKIDNIGVLTDKIAERAPKLADTYREKIKEKITKVLDGVEVDESRLLNEVAFFADKSGIDEEITRLRSHISQFRKITKTVVGRDDPGAPQPNGKKLDFLIQEFNREANTICSKSNDSGITAIAIDLKTEIEKVREQIQNIE